MKAVSYFLLKKEASRTWNTKFKKHFWGHLIKEFNREGIKLAR